jgi:ABC-type uncharacterized transport system auxiliary subunit
MKLLKSRKIGILVLLMFFAFIDCGKIVVKKFYIINYEPEPLLDRKMTGPYPYTIRIKDFSIERAYAKQQIVYRKSPYELQYYYYRVWAVKPTQMITDMIQKHIASTGIVSHVVRRLDEGTAPDYELSGAIEAIEEYDSEEIWFAHLAIRMVLTRMKDNRTIYYRRFDKRKKVNQHEPEFVINVMSQVMDFIMTQALHDIDVVLADEYGVGSQDTDKDDFNSLQDPDTVSAGEDVE